MSEIVSRFVRSVALCYVAVAIGSCAECPGFLDPGVHEYTFDPMRMGDGWGETYQVDDGHVYVDGDHLRVEYTGPDGQQVVVSFRRVADGDTADTSDSPPPDDTSDSDTP